MIRILRNDTALFFSKIIKPKIFDISFMFDNIKLVFQIILNMAGNASKIMVVLSSVRDGRHAVKVGSAVMNHLKTLPNVEPDILGKLQKKF